VNTFLVHRKDAKKRKEKPSPSREAINADNNPSVFSVLSVVKEAIPE
jgi:hypothetical protein